MKVIITGGTGFIGRHLANYLHANAFDVTVLSRRETTPLASGLHEGIHIRHWDGCSANGWEDLANNGDAIINLAGASIAGEGGLPARWTEARKHIILQSRLDAAKAVLEAIRQASPKPRLLIQASGIDYYADQTTHDKITETSPRGSGFLADVCQQWELASAEVETMGLRRVILRTGLVLSNQGGALPKMALPFKLFAGGPISHGQQAMAWIHLEDEIRAIAFLLQHDSATGPFNLCAPNPVSNAVFSRELGRALRRPARLPTPGFVFKLAFGEVSDLLLKGRYAIPEKLTQLGYTFKYPEVDQALKAIYNR